MDILGNFWRPNILVIILLARNLLNNLENELEKNPAMLATALTSARFVSVLRT